ncbi:D-alanyl-D-alanine carboxypeptidase family protein [Pararhizobium sp. IMCC21322]|uniref:D-alanyl-D-alanine carboxypeptidase family protein n=1 Tax=Pararhizobium sp. IMCC21322 TaxID=3067903 RepID=UPI002741AE20|nr:D-alanyl-D-alanine carboxypeptidase family protein [Pararhizobium sp. IMCC21322]
MGKAIFAAFLISLTASLSVTTTANANAKYAGIVIDVKSGKTLYADNADNLRYPASLTKIMTLYMLFGELEAGRVSLNTRMKVSKRASGQAPSKLALKPGSTIRVKDAISALVTKSANDVAVVIAEHIGKTESKFAIKMTKAARDIGMKKTTFKNASGLPNGGQRTTARDMARLGMAIQDRYPTYYKYFSTRSFSYKGKKYRNHNRLLGTVKGVDGIKTGYIRASGFNLVTSVKRDGRHIVAVVMGGRTGRSRDAHMKNLIGRFLKSATTGRRVTPLLASRKVPLPRARAVAAAAAEGNLIPQIRPDEIVTASVTRTASADEPEIGSADDYSKTDITDGWQIQIGAVPSEEAANILLGNAMNVGTSYLRGKVAFTEPVISRGQTLHRARFAGFTNKNAARKACNYLEAKDFACLALR